MYELVCWTGAFGVRPGAVPAREISFVFDTLDVDLPLLGQLLDEDPRQRISRTMPAAWVSFAAEGNTGSPWYGLDRRAAMRFNPTSEVVDFPRSRERGLWEGVRQLAGAGSSCAESQTPRPTRRRSSCRREHRRCGRPCACVVVDLRGIRDPGHSSASGDGRWGRGRQPCGITS